MHLRIHGKVKVELDNVKTSVTVYSATYCQKKPDIITQHCFHWLTSGFTFEPCHEKTCLWGLRPVKTQTDLLS